MRPAAALALTAALAVGAPLAGLLTAGRPLAPYLDFPPRSAAVVHPPFSWTVFVLLCVPVVAAVLLFAAALRSARPPPPSPKKDFPWWGWLGLALVAGGWLAAWHESLVAPQWRRHTFSVLWLGYVVAMNAFVARRGGDAPLTHRPGWFLCLFPASAALWWLFEYLNQFAANWHYAGVVAESALAYFAQATLPFATVLPALASTEAWLRTFPRWNGVRLPAVRAGAGRAAFAFVLGVAALAALPLLPELLFPMLWVAPALVLGALHRGYFAPLGRGDWRPVLLPAAAALVCGFFWELWNWGSLARWHYSIPYVQRFHLFEMPLLGYAGYLPFGVACALVMDALGAAVSAKPRS